jgi:TadE-like protein
VKVVVNKLSSARTASPGAGRPRRALAAMELVLILPILGIVLLAMLEFTLLFYARSSVVEASRAGARAAAVVGTSPEQVEWAAGKVLVPGLRPQMQVDWVGGEHAGDPVTVAVQVPMTAASPDLLWIIGYSLEGRMLYSESTMIKE